MGILLYICCKANEKESKEIGSRFYPDFAHDINGLLTKALEDWYEEETGVNGNNILKGNADSILFPNGVGTLSVANL